MKHCIDRYFYRDALVPLPSSEGRSGPAAAAAAAQAKAAVAQPRLALRMRGRPRPINRGIHSALLDAVRNACAATRLKEGRQISIVDGEAIAAPSGVDADDLYDTERTAARDLWANVVLCGGGSMLPTLSERIAAELATAAKAARPSSAAVASASASASAGDGASTPQPAEFVELKALNLVAGEKRHHAVWRGGAMLAELESFRAMWIRKNEWEEHGGVIVRQRQL
jgi:hypothetical protein